MNYNFYASQDDKLALLQYLFNETDLHLYDSYSAYGEEVSEYSCLEEITSKFDLDSGSQSAVMFQLWSPLFSGAIHCERINLDPDYCQGHTFRYRTSGRGLIQLYLGGRNSQGLHYSHLGHYSEKGAAAWESVSPSLGRTSLWNWQVINSTSRKLKYLLHNKWAVEKRGSIGILPGAAALEQQGVLLKL
ncbi:hypothetical protein J0X19_09620 [Hymenobacter sp. BT186]|uniref:Uncharacterized protein n=1 Tax=Hymenobacter telluris TaxID=2816474 RepID=A0A939EVY6_9BACT|nr:hypothetical protein [Hymenobacter telluris]MBO0358201.1 hypothetical protein [Hymenobacter telluris]MBW3374227.1 hypothetical protein [Hymenobacter norwichensis]